MDQGKALVEGPGGEDPLTKIDLVNFDLLLRGFLALKLFFFWLKFTPTLLNFEKNAIKLFSDK